MLCVKFGWNWPSGSGEKDENVKSLQMDRDGWQAIRNSAQVRLQLVATKSNKFISLRIYIF